MNWLREAATDGATGRVSSKRVAMLLATLSMSITEVLLAVAALYGRDVSMALAAVSVPLAGLGGYTYVNGKANELNARKEVP